MVGLFSYWASGPSESPHASRSSAVVASSSQPSTARLAPAATASEKSSNARSLQSPSGAPPSLPCDDARKVIAQARTYLAAEPASVQPQAFAAALVDWLDPHGLWSASPDSPVATSLRARAQELITELELPPGSSTDCVVADELGGEIEAWVGELRALYEEAERSAPEVPLAEAFELAQQPAFEDGPVTKPAKQLAVELGSRVGRIHRAYGTTLDAAVGSTASRALPVGDEVEWSGVLLAAALRAYLPQIDPHGGWAPLDEETSLYEVDLEASPPPRLWRKMMRTAVGIRVDESPAKALVEGDVVLAVGDVPTSCLSVEQAEQLAYVDVEGTAPLSKRVLVLRAEDPTPRRLDVRLAAAAQHGAETEERAPGLESARVPYANGEVLVVAIGDVPDNLGEELSATLTRERAEGDFLGVVLDLRGNGGGSTDGASAALGVFLPGATLFPLRRRNGGIEVERAATPPPADRWSGPVAALVDGDTASAAEMIAGAIGAYRRGPIVGDLTYGKGCAQEYLDDDAHAGILRLTTLVFALPDGSPLQRVGLTPSLRVPMPRAPEREANLLHALRPWHGPDVRERSLVRDVPWPGHAGNVGPCQDVNVCKALRALGAPRMTVARGSVR